MEAASLIAGRLDEMGARMADRADVIAILARLQVRTLTALAWREPDVVASWGMVSLHWVLFQCAATGHCYCVCACQACEAAPARYT